MGSLAKGSSSWSGGGANGLRLRRRLVLALRWSVMECACPFDVRVAERHQAPMHGEPVSGRETFGGGQDLGDGRAGGGVELVEPAIYQIEDPLLLGEDGDRGAHGCVRNYIPARGAIVQWRTRRERTLAEEPAGNIRGTSVTADATNAAPRLARERGICGHRVARPCTRNEGVSGSSPLGGFPPPRGKAVERWPNAAVRRLHRRPRIGLENRCFGHNEGTSKKGTRMLPLAIAGTGYGLIGLLVIVLLVVLILALLRRA